jgi:hypothetical protein
VKIGDKGLIRVSRDSEGIVLGVMIRGGTYLTARKVHHVSVEKEHFLYDLHCFRKEKCLTCSQRGEVGSVPSLHLSDANSALWEAEEKPSR